MTSSKTAPTKSQADASLLIRNRANEVVAQCSLWWHNVPPYPQHKLGVIGNYAASDEQAAAELLEQACTRLAAQGCTIAVGPMNGNTWQPYRFVTERGNERPFFLEPNNPDAWPRQFVARGFAPMAEYYSTLTTDLTVRDERMKSIAQRMTSQDITLRTLRPQDFGAELGRIYEVSALAFRHNFLFTTICEAEFVAQYEPLKSYVQPELVLLAEQQQKLVGYLFAVPNALQAVIDTFVIKTVAVLPEQQWAGLGSLLVARCHEIGASLGYKKAIHALMHEANSSRSISGHYAQPIRRYTLFAKELG